jgi:hypothetical protein
MTKKPKVVMLDGIAVTPITPEERKELDEALKKGHEKLRDRYREVHGKAVDWISHSVEEGSLYVNIRFKDKTDFSLQFSLQIVIDGIDLSDMKTGDCEFIRRYYKRRDD